MYYMKSLKTSISETSDIKLWRKLLQVSRCQQKGNTSFIKAPFPGPKKKRWVWITQCVFY